MSMIELPNPAGFSPLRRANSIRRTTSIDVSWPEGYAGNMLFKGVGRDVFSTTAEADPQLLDLDGFQATLDHQRTITEIKLLNKNSDDACNASVSQLLGARGGGYLRQVLVDNFTLQQLQAPLGLLLDDLSGTSLVAAWAWSRWPGSKGAERLQQGTIAIREKMEGVCIGFRPDSSALLVGEPSTHRAAPVVLLPHPEDPQGWHEMVEVDEVSMRRARRIDLWLDGDIIVEAGFQDSATTPTGGRTAVHEYSLNMVVDKDSGIIKQLSATPHILPFPECPAAVNRLDQLVGKPAAQLRSLVLEEFPRVKGCTHLNDALRSLSHVPELAEQLVQSLR